MKVKEDKIKNGQLKAGYNGQDYIILLLKAIKLLIITLVTAINDAM